MDNIYLFIIWHKALWCKEKILNDLQKDFEIVNLIKFDWSEEQFENNLKSLYGRKLGPVEDKIKPCGNGSFLLIIVRDNSPIYSERKMYDNYDSVNSKIYDKKMLYRKWTGGNHRIHCSDTTEETKHDLAVLFGCDYKKIFNNKYIHLDTKGVVGFSTKLDLLNCLKLFGNNVAIDNNNSIIIFSNSRTDIIYYLHCDNTNHNNVYKLQTKEKEEIILYIFGSLEGDMDVNYNQIDEELISNIKNNIYSYLKKDFHYVDVERHDKIPKIKMIISEIKMLFLKTINKTLGL